MPDGGRGVIEHSTRAHRSGAWRAGALAVAVLVVLLSVGILSTTQPKAAAGAMSAETGSFSATGYFHIAQATDGRWWFVTPDGQPFYSSGIDHVSSAPDVDVKTNQCPYCQAIAAQFPSTSAWATATVAQLRGWGFNTIGPYSDNSTFASKMPYTVQLQMVSGNDWFAPSFVTHADQVAATQVAPLAHDPNLIGYFTDSELTWGPNEDNSLSLLDQYLALPAGSPGLAVAQQYVGDPNGFVYDLATRYFSVTSAAVHEYDPNHLILGVKAESNDIPPELLEAASPYVDAFSVDDYALQPGDAATVAQIWPHYLPIEPNFANFEALVHKPIVIAEYSFRATGPNTPNTVPSILATYPDQTARAAAYTSYIGTMYQSAPWVIGDEWFEYVDEPAGGRFDGENSDFGVVSVNNVPYQPMVDAMSLMHAAAPDKAVSGGAECDSWVTVASSTSCNATMPALDEPLTITTNSLPTAPVQLPYSTSVVVGGGTPGYTFSVSSGQLPSGLTIDSHTGIISGTPQSLGTSTFSVAVTDSSASPVTMTMPFSLDVIQTEASDPVPTITSLSPTQGVGSGGGTITINGTGFTQGLAGPTTVSFGHAQATNVMVNASGTQLSATIPPAAANGNVAVAVSTPGGTAPTTLPFNYLFAQPQVSALSPGSGPPSGGTSVTISGNNLLGATSVLFGTNPAAFVVNSNSSITATAPVGAGGTRVDVTVSGPGGTSVVNPADQFTYGPLISGLSPNTGNRLGATTVSIRGAGFTGATAVNFGGVPASSFTVNSATLITAVSPAGAPGAVAVSVTGPAGPSPSVAADVFTYVAPAPVVSAITPSIGAPSGGTTVTISGGSFNGATTVSFGAVPATSFTVNSSTSITAVAPAGSPKAAVAVTVTGPGGTSVLVSGDVFTYGPVVTGVTPNSGSHLGHTTVTIKGAGFSGATAVDFGSVSVTQGFSVNAAGTQITLPAPAGSAGSVDVRVEVGSTQTATTPLDVFTYF